MALAINKIGINYWNDIVHDYFRKNKEKTTLRKLLNKIDKSMRDYIKNTNKETSINLYVITPRILRMLINIKSIKLKKIELLKKLLKKS